MWHLNHSSALPWHKVTSDGSLVLQHVDLSAQGNYSCYDNQGLLLHSVKLRLGCKCCDLSELTVPNVGIITLQQLCRTLVPRRGIVASEVYSLHKKQTLVPKFSHPSLQVWSIQHKISFCFSHSLSSLSVDCLSIFPLFLYLSFFLFDSQFSCQSSTSGPQRKRILSATT